MSALRQLAAAGRALLAEIGRRLAALEDGERERRAAEWMAANPPPPPPRWTRVYVLGRTGRWYAGDIDRCEVRDGGMIVLYREGGYQRGELAVITIQPGDWTDAGYDVWLDDLDGARVREWHSIVPPGRRPGDWPIGEPPFDWPAMMDAEAARTFGEGSNGA